MTTMDVHLTGLDGFGKPTGKVFAFWWDGGALKTVLEDKLEPADPWPAWTTRLPSEALRQFATQHPNVWQNKRAEFNDEMTKLLETSVEIEVLIQEG